VNSCFQGDKIRIVVDSVWLEISEKIIKKQILINILRTTLVKSTADMRKIVFKFLYAINCIKKPFNQIKRTNDIHLYF
jgi:hypothetical protein